MGFGLRVGRGVSAGFGLRVRRGVSAEQHVHCDSSMGKVSLRFALAVQCHISYVNSTSICLLAYLFRKKETDGHGHCKKIIFVDHCYGDELSGQLAYPGSPGKMAVKMECVKRSVCDHCYT